MFFLSTTTTTTTLRTRLLSAMLFSQLASHVIAASTTTAATTTTSTMSPFASLLIFCLVMAISTFILGSLPLFIRLSPTQMILLQSLAAGLLLGAGITIVLPEGVSNLYAHYHPHSHKHKKSGGYDPEHTLGFSVLVGFLLMYFADRYLNSNQPHRHFHPEQQQPANIPPTSSPPSTSSSPSLSTASTSTTQPQSQPSRTRTHSEMHLMSSPRKPSTHQRPSSSSTPLRLSGIRLFFHQSSSSPTFAGFSRASLTSLLGLVIHAFTDGIAMGAASLASLSSSSPHAKRAEEEGEEDPAASLRLIVFLAIMLHKAPAALGLSTLLLSQGGSRVGILRAIAVFSLSTPAGALATYALGWWILESKAVDGLGHTAGGLVGGGPLDSRSVVAQLASVLVVQRAEGGDDASAGEGGGLSTRHIGMALTFSAGTFLYVAMHALGELMGSPSKSPSPSSSEHHQHRGYEAVAEREDETVFEATDEEERGGGGGGRRRIQKEVNGPSSPSLDGGDNNEASSLLHPHHQATTSKDVNRRRVSPSSTSAPVSGGTSEQEDEEDDDDESEIKRLNNRHSSIVPSPTSSSSPSGSSILTLEAGKTVLLLLGAALPRFLQGLTGHGH
ncbi:hypothetical protein A4X09_0g1642 [Tilletia walkeri]|uniref:Zinc/iron permease n=1 Tax=Tilletia walkeri TaxID=117179 RepID=A0A8X7NBG8_9BASI|nr:hypothetical protein A4X09_0g1642 [Tilletia walkeri]